MPVSEHIYDDADVDRVYRRLDGGAFGVTSKDCIRAVLHAAEAVPLAEVERLREALREIARHDVLATQTIAGCRRTARSALNAS